MKIRNISIKCDNLYFAGAIAAPREEDADHPASRDAMARFAALEDPASRDLWDADVEFAVLVDADTADRICARHPKAVRETVWDMVETRAVGGTLERKEAPDHAHHSGELGANRTTNANMLSLCCEFLKPAQGRWFRRFG
jgi:hypothetical protein